MTVLLTTSIVATEPNYTSYNILLKKYVSYRTSQGVRATWVNYSALKRNSNWKKVVKMIQSFPFKLLQTSKEKAAFFINAYNIMAINTIISAGNVSSIMKVGRAFKRRVHTIAGSKYSLDSIEAKLRWYVDGRFHFAIVCAALSCPDLKRSAYTGKKLYADLWRQTYNFLKNSTKGVKLQGTSIRVSKLFSWYKKDFKRFKGTKGLLKKYRKDLNNKLTRSIKTNINYNWSLNGH